MPTDAERFSESNVLNSVALYLASKLFAAGYLVYWHKRDAVQINTSSTGWYLTYSANRATYLADPTFAAAYAAAKGLVTFVDTIPAVPRFITRLTDDTSVGPADAVPVPAMAIALGAPVPLAQVEIGTKTKWRTRHLMIDSYTRTTDEQGLFKDALANWLDENTILAIADHDAGTLAVVGSVEVLDSTVASARVVDRAEAVTYEVLLNARLEYAA